MRSDALAASRFAILAALVKEANSGERLSDKIRVADYLEAAAHDPNGAPRALAVAAGFPPTAAHPVRISDIALKLLRHLRGEAPWRAPNEIMKD